MRVCCIQAPANTTLHPPLSTPLTPHAVQVPFSKHISLTILALLAVGMATLPQNGIAHGLLHVVRHAATVRLEGEADCGLLLKAEMAVGRWVGVTLAHASPGMTGALGSKVGIAVALKATNRRYWCLLVCV